MNLPQNFRTKTTTNRPTNTRSTDAMTVTNIKNTNPIARKGGTQRRHKSSSNKLIQTLAMARPRRFQRPRKQGSPHRIYRRALHPYSASTQQTVALTHPLDKFRNLMASSYAQRRVTASAGEQYTSSDFWHSRSDDSDPAQAT